MTQRPAPNNASSLRPRPGDVLLVVDVQNDFMPGGKLAVPNGDEVVPVINRYMQRFVSQGLPVVCSRDWHPLNHCSFRAEGGPWPAHCIAGSAGAAFAVGLQLVDSALIVSKATGRHADAYSAFAGTELSSLLRRIACRRLFVCGLATDYCVLNTVRDALGHGLFTVLLQDAVRAVDQRPGDGMRAIGEMQRRGARLAMQADVLR